MILWEKWLDINFLPTAPSPFAPTKGGEKKKKKQSENNWKDLKIIYSLLLLQ